MTRTVPSKSTANVFYQGTARPRLPHAVLSKSTGRPYYLRMDNIRPRTSRSSTTTTHYRPQRPKKIMKSIWVKKGSTVGSQAVLPQKVRVKGGVMISPKQTWRPKGNYLDSVNRDNGSYTLKQFKYVTPLGLTCPNLLCHKTASSFVAFATKQVIPPEGRIFFRSRLYTSFFLGALRITRSSSTNLN
ncbi:hypothetical protein Tco_0037017 [Tanacetum coccineum]